MAFTTACDLARLSTVECLVKWGLLAKNNTMEDTTSTTIAAVRANSQHEATPPGLVHKAVVEVLPKDFKEFDIIFGREGNSNGLPGNIRFRGIVEAKKASYETTPDKAAFVERHRYVHPCGAWSFPQEKTGSRILGLS
jgi:hypothetical protein